MLQYYLNQASSRNRKKEKKKENIVFLKILLQRRGKEIIEVN